MIKKSDIIENEIYYTYLSSSESEQYGDYKPCSPIAVKATFNSHGVLILYALDEDGDIDYDTNTEYVPYVSPSTGEIEDIFITESECREQYISETIDYANNLIDLGNQMLKKIEEYREEYK